MPQADIEFNGTPASDEDFPINVLVQLSNNDIGDESTYDWEVVSQPEGTPDVLSSVNIENPTLTPTKEGSYHLQLTIDIGLPSEVIDRKIFRLRQLKTFNRLIAAEESIEVDADEGWKTAQNATIQDHDNRLVTGLVICGVAGNALTAGDIVKVTEVVTIKATLPGEEDLPEFSDALATLADVASSPLAVVIGAPDGSAGMGPGELVLVMFAGLFNAVTFAGAPTLGDDVYVSDTGVPVLVPGTNTRVIGTVVNVGAGVYTALINGLHSAVGGIPPGVAQLAVSQQFTANQHSHIVTLTDALTTLIDATDSNIYSLTATGGVGATRQLDNPTLLVAGMTWQVWFIQDGTGGRALTFDTFYDWGDEGAPDFTPQIANVKNVITCVALSPTQIAATALKGFA